MLRGRVVGEVCSAEQVLTIENVLQRDGGIFHHIVHRHKAGRASLACLTVKVHPCVRRHFFHEIDKFVDGLWVCPFVVGDGETDVAHARMLDQLTLRHRRRDADGLLIFLLLFLVEVREHDILALCTANAHVLVTQCLVLRPADIAPVVLAVPADGVPIHEAVRLLPQIDDTDRGFCARVQVFQQRVKGRDGELRASRERQGV